MSVFWEKGDSGTQGCPENNWER